MRLEQYKPIETPALIADVKGSDSLTCQCKGWQYRKDCRHTKMVRKLIELHKEVKIVSAWTPVGNC